MMPTLNIKHGKIKRKKVAKYIFSIYSNYNTSNVRGHRTILKSERDKKMIYIIRNFKSN